MSIILIFIMGLQLFYPLAICSYYYANKNYVASALCENKDKPQLQCQGKCFLKKQLDRTEKEDKKEKTALKGAETAVYIPATLFDTAQNSYAITTDYPLFKLHNYTFLLDRTCFHPPAV